MKIAPRCVVRTNNESEGDCNDASWPFVEALIGNTVPDVVSNTYCSMQHSPVIRIQRAILRAVFPQIVRRVEICKGHQSLYL